VIAYIIILTLPIIAWAMARYSREGAYFALLVLLALFAGSRYGIGGYDYFVYRTAFSSVPEIGNINGALLGNMPAIPYEPLFVLFMSLCKSFGFSFSAFLLLYSLASIGVIGCGIKRITPQYFFVILLYILNSYIWQNFTIIRQAMAFGIIINALPDIQEKRPLHFFGLVFFAAMWHVSSLIFLPAYFLLQGRTTAKKMFLYGISGIILFLLFNVMKDQLSYSGAAHSVFSRKLLGYFIGPNGAGINQFQIVECGLLLILGWPLIQDSKSDYIIDYSYQLVICMLILTLVFRRYEFFSRFLEYYKIGIIILAAAWCRDTLKSLDSFKTLCCFSYFSLKYIRYLFTFDGGALMPYRSFLFR
jgi:hypothetical protein